MASPLDSIGLSFAPGQRANPQQGPDQGNLSPVQQAIKILSLRVPQNAGAGGITPNALLTGPGAAGLGAAGGGFDLMALLRQLFQQGPNAMGAGQAPLGAPPLPHVTPGQGPMTPQPGPGMPTFPTPGGGPAIDRRQPGIGNRSGAPILNDLPSGTDRPPVVRGGPLVRTM